MTGFSRGAALVETAFSIGIAMIVLLATMQLGALGFKQSTQDGAAFVAAHTYAQSPVSGVARATTAANSVFGTIPTAGIAVAPASASVTATIATTASAPSIPGAPAAIGLRSGATERVTPLAGTLGAFTSTDVLTNYRDASGNPAVNRPLGIAQPGLPQQSNCDNYNWDGYGWGDDGEGYCGCDWNYYYYYYTGPFAEWSCRQATYAGLAFPSTRPHSGYYTTGPYSVWDVTMSWSPLYVVYGWDDGRACS